MSIANNDSIEDFYSGEINKQFMNENKEKFLSGECLSLSFSTDGINICEKSNLSIWPIILFINELPIQNRFCIENTIIAGIAVSNGKPAIEYLINNVVQNLKKLEFGVAFNARSENYRNVKFFLLSGVYDKPARAMVLNIKNSTGFYGCLKCLQPGKTLRTKKGGNVHIYPFTEAIVRRNEFNYSKSVEKVLKKNLTIGDKGIKGKCYLEDLQYFHPILNSQNIRV